MKNLAASQVYTFQHFQMAIFEVNFIPIDVEGWVFLKQISRELLIAQS